MGEATSQEVQLPYGWCDFGDLYHQWLRLLPDDAVVVEVGSYLGQSAIIWGALARKRQRPIKLICIDLWAGVADHEFIDADARRQQRRLLLEHGGSLRPVFDRHVAQAGVEAWVDARTLSSLAAAATFAPGTVDRVMLDADHEAAAVRADLDAWWPTLKVGGELVGHDDNQPRVHDTVRAWAAEHGLGVYAVSNNCWRLPKPAPVTSWTVPEGARACLVAVCSNERTIYRQTVQSLLHLGWGAAVPKAAHAHGFHDVKFSWFDRSPSVDVLREEAAVAAVRASCSHLLFLDADMTWPSDLLTRMLAHHDRGVVSGLYYLKAWPHQPVAFLSREWNPTDQVYDYAYDQAAAHEGPALRKELLIGLGCALVPTRVFELYPRPWFEYRRNARTGLLTISEDVAFCEHLTDLGVPIWLDPTIECGHIGQAEVLGQHHDRALFDVAHIEAGTTPLLPHEMSPREKRRAQA